jgi:hypothetical protein
MAGAEHIEGLVCIVAAAVYALSSVMALLVARRRQVLLMMLGLLPSLMLWIVGSCLYGGISGWLRWLLIIWGAGLVIKPAADFISRTKAGLTVTPDG